MASSYRPNATQALAPCKTIENSVESITLHTKQKSHFKHTLKATNFFVGIAVLQDIRDIISTFLLGKTTLFFIANLTSRYGFNVSRLQLNSSLCIMQRIIIIT